MKSTKPRKTLSDDEKKRRANLRSESITNALNRFNAMPDSAYIRLPVVKELFGVSGPTIYRMIKAGNLEPPERIGAKSSGFRVGAIRKALGVNHG